MKKGGQRLQSGSSVGEMLSDPKGDQEDGLSGKILEALRWEVKVLK